MLAMVKFTRYANNWEKGHQDSIRDAAVYCAMLEAVDSEYLGLQGPSSNCVGATPPQDFPPKEPITVSDSDELPLTRQTEYIYSQKDKHFYKWEDGEYQRVKVAPRDSML
jgi:hypothetical protein